MRKIHHWLVDFRTPRGHKTYQIEAVSAAGAVRYTNRFAVQDKLPKSCFIDRVECTD